jgi:hypothetical protein
MEVIGKERNWFTRHRMWTAALVYVGLFVLGSAIVIVSNTRGFTPAVADVSATAGGWEGPPARSTDIIVGPVPSLVLLDLKGSGSNATQRFTVVGYWDLNWSYDCSDNHSVVGNFSVDVKSDVGMVSDNQGVSQLGAKGSGVEHYHTGGVFYLEISSACKWTVQVQD